MIHLLKNEIHRIYLDKNNNEVTINRFNVTYHYTILEQINDLPQYGYAVLNHLYANPGLEADFERVFLNRDKHLENTEGFENLLFLKPHSTHEHHVIITFWQDEAAYKHWVASLTFFPYFKMCFIIRPLHVSIFFRKRFSCRFWILCH